MREVDPTRQRAHGEPAENVGGEGGRGRHRGDVVEAEDGREDVERGHVPHVEQEDQREAAHAVVEGERTLAPEAVADPAGENRAYDVHGAHQPEGLRRVHLREAVLGRVRDEVREHEAVGGVAAHEEGRGEEPERGRAHGLGHGHTPLVTDTAEGPGSGGIRPVRLEALVFRVIAHESQDDRNGENEHAYAEPEKGRAPAVEPDEDHGERYHEHLARGHGATQDAQDEPAPRHEPARSDARRGGHAEPARAHGHEHARACIELPEMSHERGEHGADAEDDRGEEHDSPRTPGVGEPAHHGADRAQHEEGEGGRPRELLARPSELGLDGFDEHAEDGPNARTGQHHEDHRDEQDPPVVESTSGSDHGTSVGRLHSSLEMRGSGAGIRHGPVMRPATSDCNPSPIGPCRSYSRVCVNPTPWGSMVVTASRPIHSPSGRRWSETLRSALMKGAKLTGSSTAPTPLPESAMRRMRWAGDGSSPATSGTRWRIHSAALPEPTRPRATRDSMAV